MSIDTVISPLTIYRLIMTVVLFMLTCLNTECKQIQTILWLKPDTTFINFAQLPLRVNYFV